MGKAWEAAWAALFQTLGSLQEADLLKKITIRGEEHSVLQAIQRSYGHTSYHVGQIVYLAKHFAGPHWTTLTIPKGQSAEARGGYKKIG